MKPAKLLATAAGEGDLDAMRAVLAEHPEAAKDWQPIMDACYVGQRAAVELLLDRGADPNVVSKSPHRYRPLHRAMERKVTFPRTEAHVAIVKLLLERGANPLLPGAWHQLSAIAIAAGAGDRRFLSLLLARVPQLDLYDAAVTGQLGRVRALLAEDPTLARQPHPNGWSPLRYCCESRLGEDDPERAEALRQVAALLIEHGADLAGCLDAVVYRNNPTLTGLFLLHGATIHDGDILNHSACEGAHDALAVLVKHGTDLNNTTGTEHHGGYTPFGCALTMRSLRGAQWFLDQDLDPNYVGGPSGETSLHVAVRSGAGVPLLQLLLDRGADPNARDSTGLTPLAAAEEKGHEKAAAFLAGISSR